MTYEEMIELAGKPKSRKKPDDYEHRLQVACVKWFRFQYPKLKNVLFAIPNGGRRDAVTGGKLKDEGVTSGVSDLILLKSNRLHGALCIEMKRPEGYQRQSQKAWQKDAEANGAKYVVCKSIDDFQKEVTNYLKDL